MLRVPRLWGLALFSVVWIGAAAEAVAGGGGAARSEVRVSSSSSSSSTTHRHSSFSRGSMTAQFISDPATPAPRPIRTWYWRYSAHPYESPNGHIRRVPTEHRQAPPKRFGGNASVHGAYLFKQRYRYGVSLRFGGPWLEIDTQFSYLMELTAKQSLYLGDSNLNVVILKLPRIVWRVGGGARYRIDGRAPDPGPREYAAGPNATTSFDAFPIRPLVLSGRADVGTYYKTPVYRLRGTVGLVGNRFELYAGWEHLQIFTVGRGGPTGGVRVWF